MADIKEIKKKFNEKRPVEWEMIPDIPLTKNQVVMYMPRQLVGQEGDDDITSAMINNYIKDGVMPRANGKFYNREHIAYLTAISILKKSLPVKDISYLIELTRNDGETKDYYSCLNETLDKELTIAAKGLMEEMNRQQITDLALELAVSVYARRTLCEQLVAMLSEEDKALKEAEKDKEKDKNKKKD